MGTPIVAIYAFPKYIQSKMSKNFVLSFWNEAVFLLHVYVISRWTLNLQFILHKCEILPDYRLLYNWITLQLNYIETIHEMSIKLCQQ